MPKYTVKVGTLKHDKKAYVAGTDQDTVELTEAQAAALPPGIVEPVPEKKAAKPPAEG